MKTNFFPIFITLILMLASCNSESKKKDNNDLAIEPFWNIEKAKKQALDFNSSDTWDTKTLEMEIGYIDALTSLDFPFFTSPFPTPEYESPGNGNSSIETEIGGKKIIGHTVIIGRGEHSEHLFKTITDEYITYFTILTIADSLKTENPVIATSRNHPHYLAQGSLNKSSKSRVDWVAIQLADKNAYSIVNARIFDLRVGRLILVAPQKDGSIRFYQTQAPTMNLNEREKFIENLKTQPKAIAFFSDHNNI